MKYYKDKVAVVTGGAQGIGRCIVHEFLQAGGQRDAGFILIVGGRRVLLLGL